MAGPDSPMRSTDTSATRLSNATSPSPTGHLTTLNVCNFMSQRNIRVISRERSWSKHTVATWQANCMETYEQNLRLEEAEMLRVSVIVLALCLGVTMLAPVALADQFDKKTVLTVNEPIQVPGKVLMPGKYVVKLFDSLSNRNIVQIFNEDETEV